MHRQRRPPTTAFPGAISSAMSSHPAADRAQSLASRGSGLTPGLYVDRVKTPASQEAWRQPTPSTQPSSHHRPGSQSQDRHEMTKLRLLTKEQNAHVADVEQRLNSRIEGLVRTIDGLTGMFERSFASSAAANADYYRSLADKIDEAEQRCSERQTQTYNLLINNMDRVISLEKKYTDILRQLQPLLERNQGRLHQTDSDSTVRINFPLPTVQQTVARQPRIPPPEDRQLLEAVQRQYDDINAMIESDPDSYPARELPNPPLPEPSGKRPRPPTPKRPRSRRTPAPEPALHNQRTRQTPASTRTSRPRTRQQTEPTNRKLRPRTAAGRVAYNQAIR